MINNYLKLQELEFAQFVIRNLPVAVVAVDGDRRITGYNLAAEEITGYSQHEVLGRFCGEVLRGGMCREECPLSSVLDRRHPVVQVETTVRDRWGATIPIRLHVGGLYDSSGKLIGGVEDFVDISQLKALERERTNLLSMFAHDMKSPLVSIHGFLDRLLRKRDELGVETTERYLQIIKKEATKLESLVENFLEYGRLQRVGLRLKMQPSSLVKILVDLLDSFETRASRKGVAIDFSPPENFPLIEADPELLQRAFANLLDNALKFSKNGGKATIEIQEKESHVQVTISDEGQGIDPEDIPYIFDPYHRGKSSVPKEGYGVGLATVKAIVEGHEGRVSVRSEPGQGSVFTVLLPKKRGARNSRTMKKGFGPLPREWV